MARADEPDLFYIDHAAFIGLVRSLAERIERAGWRPDFLIGIGRGGLVPAVYLSHMLELPMLSIDRSARVPGFADDLLVAAAAMSARGTRLMVVDDINDSGGTIEDVRTRLTRAAADFANVRFAAIFNNAVSRATVDLWAERIDRAEDKRWFVFPWEAETPRAAIVAEAHSVPDRLA